jgi:hypothetical protein
MSPTKIKIRQSKKDKNGHSYEYDFGANLEEAVAKFDGDSPLEKVVYGLFLSAARQQLSEFVRSHLVPRGKGKDVKKAMTPAEIQEALKSWKPAVERRAQANVSKAEKILAALSPEERKALELKIYGDGGEGQETEGPEE